MTTRRSSVLDVNEWMRKADELLAKITNLVSTNDITSSTNSYPQYVTEIVNGVVELGFRDVIHFCESFPAKFVIHALTGLITLPTEETSLVDTPTRRVLQQPKMKKKKEQPKPKHERKKSSNQKKQSTQTTEKKPNIDEETMALLANYNPVPPSLRMAVKKEEPLVIEPVKKAECIHFKFAHDGKMRRFAFPRDYSTLIGAVKHRVQDILGEKRDLLLYWRDDESLIILECGEDMQAAIDFAESQMKPPACITIEADVEKEEKEDGSSAEKKKEEVFEEEREEDVTPRIVSRDESSTAFNGFAFMCDACDCYLAPSNGGRYKCMICDNYDLCAACVAKGVHYNHALVRLLNSETAVPLVDASGGSKNVPLKKTRRCTPAFVAKNTSETSTVNHVNTPVEQPDKISKYAEAIMKSHVRREKERLEREKRNQAKAGTTNVDSNDYFDVISSLRSESVPQEHEIKQTTAEMEKKEVPSIYKKTEEEVDFADFLTPMDKLQMEQEDKEAWRQLEQHVEQRRKMEQAEEEKRKEEERAKKELAKKKLEIVIDAETKQIKTIDEERKKQREEKKNKENREHVEEKEDEERVHPMLSSLFKLMQKEEKVEEGDTKLKDILDDLDDLFESDSDTPLSTEGDIEEMFEMDEEASINATLPARETFSPILYADDEAVADHPAATAAPPSPLATATAVAVGNVNLDSENGKIVWSSERWRSNEDPGVVTQKFLKDREEFLARSEEISSIPAHIERILLSEMYDKCSIDQFLPRLEALIIYVNSFIDNLAFQEHREETIFMENREVENEMMRLIAADLADRLQMMYKSVGFALPEIRRKLIGGRISELAVMTGGDAKSQCAAMKLRKLLCNDSPKDTDTLNGDVDEPKDDHEEKHEVVRLVSLDELSIGCEHIECPGSQKAASSCASSISILSRKCSSDGSDIEVIDMLVEDSQSVLETMQELESKFADLEFKSMNSSLASAKSEAGTQAGAAAPYEVDAPVAAADTAVPPAATATAYSAKIAPLTDDMFLPPVSSTASSDFYYDDADVDRVCSSSQIHHYAFPSEEWNGPDQEEVEAELQNFIVESRRDDVKNISAFMEYNILLELHDMENLTEIPVRLAQYCTQVCKNTMNLKEHKTILSQDKQIDKELVKRIAVDLGKRLNNMRKIVDYAMPCNRKGMILNRVCELRVQIKEFKYDELWFETVCRELHTILLTNEYTISYSPMKSIERGWKFVIDHANDFVQQAKATAPKLGDLLHPHAQSTSNSGPPPPFAKTDPLKNESTDDEDAEAKIPLLKKVPTVKNKPSAPVQIIADQLLYDVQQLKLEPLLPKSSDSGICKFLSPPSNKKPSPSWDPWEDEYPAEPIPSAPEEPRSGLSTAAAASARSLGDEMHSLDQQNPAVPRENIHERRAEDEELTEKQQRLLSELFETGIFDDYERMVHACRLASNLEQAIELMLVEM